MKAYMPAPALDDSSDTGLAKSWFEFFRYITWMWAQ